MRLRERKLSSSATAAYDCRNTIQIDMILQERCSDDLQVFCIKKFEINERKSGKKGRDVMGEKNIDQKGRK